MNTLEKLIAKFCPNGVEYKPLGEMCDIGTGSSNRNEASTEGKYPFFVRSRQAERMDTYEFDEEAIIIPGEGGIGEIFHYIKGKYALHQRVYRIHFHDNTIDVRFAYYYLVAHFRMFILGKAVVATVSSIRKPMIEKFQLPIPPLPVQKEIVRMLDEMAGLIDVLEEELAARKKQYEWYRDRLLRINGEEDCYKLTLGEVCEVLDNMRVPVSKKDRKAGPYPYYGANGIQDYVDSYIFDGTFLLVGEDGSVINEDGSPVLNWVQGKVWVNNHAHVLKGTDKADLRYLFYLLQTNDISAMVRGTPPKLNQENLKRITVMLPPLSEQRRIVKILDNIDTVCNSMTEGLPGEIALRKQQYEFYRDKLLTFKKAV